MVLLPISSAPITITTGIIGQHFNWQSLRSELGSTINDVAISNDSLVYPVGKFI